VAVAVETEQKSGPQHLLEDLSLAPSGWEQIALFVFTSVAEKLRHKTTAPREFPLIFLVTDFFEGFEAPRCELKAL